MDIWNGILDLYRMCGDGGREAEAYQMHANFSQHLMIDDSTSHQCSEHALISWVEQPLAQFLQLNSNMATPSTSNMMIMPAPTSSIMWNKKQQKTNCLLGFFFHCNHNVIAKYFCCVSLSSYF